MWISRPAGMCAVPLGDTAVCQAGTSLTQPQSKATVPPKFGSRTSSTPSPLISAASSTIATTVAPVRLAMSTVSPRWSPWPWVSRITSGSTSSAVAAASGLPVRNGSVRTVVPPALSSKQDCPRNRTSTAISVSFLQHLTKFVPDGNAHEHAQARLLRDQVADRGDALVGIGLPGGSEHLRLVRGAEPVGGIQRLVQDPLKLRGAGLDEPLRLLQARRVAQGLDRSVDLGVGVALGHGGAS